MTRTKYLHTIDGCPAFFDGYQLCFAVRYGKPCQLASSLRQIKREQSRSKRNRSRDGLQNDVKYGYFRVA